MAIRILAGLGLIFARPLFVVLAAGLAALIFVISALVPNLGLAWEIASAASISLADKIQVLASLIGSIGAGSSGLSIATNVMVAALFGANGAAVAFLLGRRVAGAGGATQAATSLAGAASGIAGLGCAACGTVAIGPVFSLLGLSSAFAFLPLGGQEFGIVAVALLSGSLLLSAKRAAAALCCPIETAFVRPGRADMPLSDRALDIDRRNHGSPHRG